MIQPRKKSLDGGVGGVQPSQGGSSAGPGSAAAPGAALTGDPLQQLLHARGGSVLQRSNSSGQRSKSTGKRTAVSPALDLRRGATLASASLKQVWVGGWVGGQPPAVCAQPTPFPSQAALHPRTTHCRPCRRSLCPIHPRHSRQQQPGRRTSLSPSANPSSSRLQQQQQRQQQPAMTPRHPAATAAAPASLASATGRPLCPWRSCRTRSGAAAWRAKPTAGVCVCVCVCVRCSGTSLVLGSVWVARVVGGTLAP
jgi:hypothetical protein